LAFADDTLEEPVARWERLGGGETEREAESERGRFLTLLSGAGTGAFSFGFGVRVCAGVRLGAVDWEGSREDEELGEDENFSFLGCTRVDDDPSSLAEEEATGAVLGCVRDDGVNQSSKLRARSPSRTSLFSRRSRTISSMVRVSRLTTLRRVSVLGSAESLSLTFPGPLVAAMVSDGVVGTS
jgi:hypothetical protein